jgi:sigma-B regulation protein RsbU (phosphoserine phosphatase)
VIGDVSGKSISAALYMARLTGELRSRTGIAQTPRRLLRQVNEALSGLGDDGMFATLIYAIYDFDRRSLLFSNAGHIPPLLRRDGRVSMVHAEAATVPPLGVIGELEIGEASIQLQQGDLIVLATDGIHEARNAAGEEYGEQRLARCIASAGDTSGEVIEAILADVAAHAQDAVQRDDVTIVALSIGDTRARRRSATDVGDLEPARARAVTAG